MGGKKRKQRRPQGLGVENEKKDSRKKMRKDERRRKTGLRLPSALRKELSKVGGDSRNSDDESDVERKGDVYEYEEGIPEEEKGSNRRFDPVEDVEYELPDDFEDEDLPSDDEPGSDEEGGSGRSDDGEKDEDAHLRMLQGITGMPGHAFRGNKRKEPVFSDGHGANGGDAQISIQDLLDPLHGKPGYSSLRKRLQHIEKKPMTIQAPLPRVERERLERKVAYEHTKKDMTKWEPLVKRNREAPTIYFDEDVDIGYSTVGAIASEFRPRTDFEKKMAQLVQNPEIVEAHQKDGDKLLTLNKISIEDMKNIQNYRAKMKSLLFRHEMKAKRIKKIKSKTYHRMLKKGKLKEGSDEGLTNPDVIKEQAMRREFKRAEERMTLKHKNSSKWAKRILKRGLNAQDEGTKAALTEQLHQHSLLTRKMDSVKDGSSSEDSSDDDDDDLSDDSLTGGASKLLTRAKEKTMKVMEEEDETSKSGLLSLPFMIRGLKKKNEALLEEGRAALQEYDSSLKGLNNDNRKDAAQPGASSGRRVFGASRKEPQENIDEVETDAIGDGSDSEAERRSLSSRAMRNSAQRPQRPSGEVKTSHEGGFKNIDEITKETGSKITYDVSIFDIDYFGKAAFQDSDMDSEEEMVDGFLSGGARTRNERSSEGCAFDLKDVEGEFEREKLEVLTQEVPEPEKPVLLPGWGEWTRTQKKRGLPKWMLNEHDEAKRKREEALKKRKDAHLKHVIISEKMDKKAEKLHTRALPFPFTSKEVFEQSIRMPIGPEYNPAVSHNALNRPAVVKKPGIIIKPIQFEEVSAHEKSTEPNRPSQTKSKRGKAPGKQAKAPSKGKKS
ncbi:unnamed protein product [Spirodela intermedia]|uniref:Uncharacterized protein n=1 Tax=Spirodela intermedia TaxID=51605 RepID=A0A7I8JG25_SPIIN|nr:unnamed protein product [Spirodela intermedia]CAA6669107.1 unnamed protein product [Spirodela intermedia]